MPAAAWFRLAGCALLAALLLLAGCGGSGSSSTVSTVISSSSPTARTEKATVEDADPEKAARKGRSTPGGPCQSQLGSFVASMDSLRRRLAVGLTYDQYVAEVRGIRSTYEKIPIERVQIGCLSAIGTPGEKAFNRYIEAANDWGNCVSEAGCDSATVEPVLQRRWRIASHFLSGADAGLNATAP